MPAVGGAQLRGPALAELKAPTLRLASFNIHRGVGRDGQLDLTRVAACLAGRDVVGLYEVGDPLGQADQAAELANKLAMGWEFAPSERRWWHGHLGNALLSRGETKTWQAIPLPGTRGKGYRNMIESEIAWRGTTLRVLAVHVDSKADRDAQLAIVIERFWRLPTPAVLMGDLNASIHHPAIAALRGRGDVGEPIGEQTGDTTSGRIDWIFTRGLRCERAGIIDNGASDHGCVWADVELAPETTTGIAET